MPLTFYLQAPQKLYIIYSENILLLKNFSLPSCCGKAAPLAMLLSKNEQK